MKSSQKLIEFAKKYLEKQPFDIVHDLEHHEQVVANCLDIIKQEGLQPDMDVIITAAWWHDVEKSYETKNSADKTIVFFRKTAEIFGADDEFINQCVDTIQQHSFSQPQRTLEGKILFDADKIEYVNDGRIGKLVDDFVANPHKYQPNHLQSTHDIWIARIKKVHDMMHFAFSKKVFQTKLRDTENILEKLQRALKK
jgi:HD superfamily phosphodiesterase